MSIREIRSSINGADELCSSVHAQVHGSGNDAELARAIHLLCSAVGDLTDEVEGLQREID